MTQLRAFRVPPQVQAAHDEAKRLGQPAGLTAWTDQRVIEYRIGGVIVHTEPIARAA